MGGGASDLRHHRGAGVAALPINIRVAGMSERYGQARIKRGLFNFALGKGVSALAGMAAIVMVIRALSVQSFAAYSVLVALVEIVTAISRLGLAQALLRYAVPELYAKHFQVSLRRFVNGSITITQRYFARCCGVGVSDVGRAGATHRPGGSASCLQSVSGSSGLALDQ